MKGWNSAPICAPLGWLSFCNPRYSDRIAARRELGALLAARV